MHTQKSNLYCHKCESEVLAEKNVPSIAFGLLTGGLSHSQVDTSWHCANCGARLDGLLSSPKFRKLFGK